ncbi:hypothetical protein F7646_13015 [Tenacibaculum finnmarkense genomovar finnmarkense]|uniref:hypothetical protein n=1 Tax=Tenacibaculum finnmarkense TaxID=2781243 RepID=UPI00187B2268|nr:hypothetical protein [Tenacibaculum finnmarkense]MBE7661493.1 hypothetical protein [Tenacibaculum finnmarkense genomovar finnmarkense]
MTILENKIKTIALETCQNSKVSDKLVGAKYDEIRKAVDILLTEFSTNFVDLSLPKNIESLQEPEYYSFIQDSFKRYLNILKYVTGGCCG